MLNLILKRMVKLLYVMWEMDRKCGIKNWKEGSFFVLYWVILLF